MRRALLLLCALAFLGFAAYGSVVPLRMRHVSLLAGVEAFLKTPFVPLSRASRTDFATNVLLFVPIGFFALGAAAPRLRTHAAVLLAPVVVAASAASVAIEFSQSATGRPFTSQLEQLTQLDSGLRLRGAARFAAISSWP